jgi:hypothetical protein
MSARIAAMADQAERLAAALARVRATAVRVEIVQRPVTDRVAAAKRTRLEDPREIAALKRRLSASG